MIARVLSYKNEQQLLGHNWYSRFINRQFKITFKYIQYLKGIRVKQGINFIAQYIFYTKLAKFVHRLNIILDNL